jgi:hypothetical protein
MSGLMSPDVLARASEVAQRMYNLIGDERRAEVDLFAEHNDTVGVARFVPLPEDITVFAVWAGDTWIGLTSARYLLTGQEPDVWPPAWFDEDWLPPPPPPEDEE